MENNRAPWAKIEEGEGGWHHLAHHCADVAACLEVISSLPVFRRRMEAAAGRVLTTATFARLAVLAFLHDAGKLHPGFQAKGWPQNAWFGPRHGHVREGAAIFTAEELKPTAVNLCLAELIDWGTDKNLLFSVLAHHGRPIDYDITAAKSWEPVKTPYFTYDPVSASAEIPLPLPQRLALCFAAGFLRHSLPSQKESHQDPNLRISSPAWLRLPTGLAQTEDSFLLCEISIPVTSIRLVSKPRAQWLRSVLTLLI